MPFPQKCRFLNRFHDDHDKIKRTANCGSFYQSNRSSWMLCAQLFFFDEYTQALVNQNRDKRN